MLTLGSSAAEVGVYAVDPDLHFTSLVGLDGKGKVIAVGQTDVPKKTTGSFAAIDLYMEMVRHLDEAGCILPQRRVLLIEDQHAYMGGKNAASLILLARASGIALCVYSQLLRPTRTLYVQPHVWKGSVPKTAHQARIVERCGLPAVSKGYSFKITWPGEHGWASDLPAGKQGHLVDALGLAMWGLKQGYGAA